MESRLRATRGFTLCLIWFAWTLGLVVWTYLLIAPVDWLPPWLRFGGSGMSKLLTWSRIGHASAYALLAAIVPFLRLRRGSKIALWGVLSIHAFTTEYVQTFVPTRSGSWIDVATDHVGIAAGLVIGLGLARQWKSSAVQTHQNAG